MSWQNIHSEQLRPRRVWYWIGGAVIAVGVVVALGGCGIGLVRVLALPDFEAEFADGEEIEFHVDETTDPDRDMVLYVNEDIHHAYEVNCELTGPGSPSGVYQSFVDHSGHSGGNHWHRLATIDVAEPGTHTITCTNTEGLEYAIAHTHSDSAANRNLVLTLLLPAGGLGAGVVLGGTILTITGLLRRQNRRQLNQHRHIRGTGHGPASPSPRHW
ncbi:hypothetical protein RIF23_15035 [Lipingzhangella sp. LS1_29]|uniref:Ig-like domain-containing protein n=1 Tax=Lipingzhangella rawalii TaxID=2055835 RepID=A0ABU2H8K7_9ACTN|nr:hypothetical protein [Lipingzhangella rawalii]MDS1271608.1 hypothetical protein [Lipingzhangella rawalii]